MKEERTTPLRQRMIEDKRIRGMDDSPTSGRAKISLPIPVDHLIRRHDAFSRLPPGSLQGPGFAPARAQTRRNPCGTIVQPGLEPFRRASAG
jgi:hypothetical protein